MSRSCIFCDEKQNSKEHVFSVWLHEYLNLPDDLEHIKITGQAGNVDGKQVILQSNKLLKKNNILGLRVPAVCETCNNGWMGTLEEKTKNYLTPLMLGNELDINQSGLKLLQQWITLKLIIIEF